MRRILAMLLAAILSQSLSAKADEDYKTSAEYIALRDSMRHSFNEGDSTRFQMHVNRLKRYLLAQKDIHAYYTQRCNEIVFLLNREKVFEAYLLATQLSKELTEKKLDKEMYMAINMMGHIYRYSGNKDSAKRCFWEVIKLLERENYTESMPAIYMNLVNIYVDEDPQEALRLIDKAMTISREVAPERTFDIETRRTLVYYKLGDMQRFLDGYKLYKEGQAQGHTSVHGRSLEVYYLVTMGKVDEAARMAEQVLDDDRNVMADIYAKAGRWEDAYRMMRLEMQETDSVNSVILSGNMQGIQEELRHYEAERAAAKRWLYALLAIACLLSMLVVALTYIVQSRRKHLREMQKAYQRILESDKMKTDFIQNISHEVRTPLNIISGYAQVFAVPGYEMSQQERSDMAKAVIHNTHLITTMIDEVLDMALEHTRRNKTMGPLPCNKALRNIIADFCKDSQLPAQVITFDTQLSDYFTVKADEHTLSGVVTPLLDNAAKNIPEHGGRIVLRASEKDGQLLLTVEDNGPGIPAAEAEHIFERFVKLNQFKEGLGLGLTYCRIMAARMNGTVHLDTTFAGPGARFVVTV